MLDRLIIALGAPATADPAAAAASGAVAGAAGTTPGQGNFFFIILLGFLVLMYLMMYIPERRRRKKLQEQISALKQGDKVMTSGGLVGTVDYIGEKTVYLRSQDSKIEVVKESIITIVQ